MRSVVLDTETTGLNAGLGDRIIELGCIEVLSRRVTGNHFHRPLHGALRDAALLAEVYLAMTRGQESLAIELGQPRPALGRAAATEGERPPLIVLRPSAEELAEHASLLADMEAENKTQCVWRRFETAVEMLDRV